MQLRSDWLLLLVSSWHGLLEAALPREASHRQLGWSCYTTEDTSWQDL